MSDESSAPRCLACDAALTGEALAEDAFQHGEGALATVWRYRLLRCEACGMGRLFPNPSGDTLAALHGSDYDAYRDDAAGTSRSVAQRLKLGVASLSAAALNRESFVISRLLTGTAHAAELAFARSVPLTASVPLTLRREAALLDFGCGAGIWLMAMQGQGYQNLSAFDVGQPALAQLERAGIRAYADDAARLPSQAFDCIRMEHVLEHVVDPTATLQLLREKLTARGTIALCVPNFGSASAARLKNDWRALKLPHHLSHFTASALQRVARAAGFQIKRVRFVPISELGVPRAAAGRWRWQLARHRYHALNLDSPAGDFLSAELEPV